MSKCEVVDGKLMANIDDLVDNELSANEEDGATFNKLVEQMRKYGFKEPVEVKELPDGRFKILSGHHRTKAWKSLGHTTIWIEVQDQKMEKEEEFNYVNNRNFVRGETRRGTLIKTIRKNNLDPTKLDLFKFPVSQLLPKMSEEDLAKMEDDAKRRAKINKMTLELAKEIASTLVDEKDEIVSVMVIKDKIVTVFRVPFKDGSRARGRAGEIKDMLKKDLTAVLGEAIKEQEVD